MTRVFINPTDKQVRDDNGVGRVVLEQYKRLPEHGVELVGSPDEAEVIATHISGDGLPFVDVLHTHGLYWTEDKDSGSYNTWHRDANRRIIAAARQARAITVPSEWVAMPFKRDMRLSPMVIGHGIDIEEWEPMPPQGYALWNKNRPSDVCSPVPAMELAKRGVQVVTTFRLDAATPDHLHTIGVQPFEKMKEWIQHASYYLATTKETFGLGTLEALASGVPVLGFRWGGTADLVTHLENGYLVEPGDYDGLAEGARYIDSHFQQMREAARETARGYTWDKVMSAYARIYNLVAYEKQTEEHTVAVVITNYNYGEWVGEAIESALAQTLPPTEVIVVDDGSTDVSHETISRYTGVRAIYQDNQGVAAARNNGIRAARSKYIICLDADDRLLPNAIETLLPAFIEDRALGVAYGNLNLLHPNGSTSDGQWRQPFLWRKQAQPSNPPATCIPCAAMFRKSMWERSGGYKQVYAPGEDAEYWTRGLSVGYTARQVTTNPLFEYRIHGDSASRTKQYKPVDTYHPWMRDKQYPMGAPSDTWPVVRSYSEPIVSVIIPVGPDHLRYLPAALDSLLGQTLREWEVIVVNDGNKPVTTELVPYPFVEYDSTGGGKGAGYARNVGIRLAKAPLVLFLDADDYLDPNALGQMLRAFVESKRYVYTDWMAFDGKEAKAETSPEYDASRHLDRIQHAVTALIPTEWVRSVGGFDESLPAWEDWDFQIKLAINGFWGIHLAQPLLYYRYHTGTRREQAKANAQELKSLIQSRYADYLTGAKTMAGCCGGNGEAHLRALNLIQGAGTMAQESDNLAAGAYRLKFIGDNTGSIPYKSKTPNGPTYRGGNNASNQYVDVPADYAALDVPFLLGLGVWQVVREPAPVEAASRVSTFSVSPEPAQVLTHHTGGNVLQFAPLPPDPVPSDELVPVPQTESGYPETAVAWFDIPVKDVQGIMPHIAAALEGAGIHTLGNVATRSDEELLAIKGIGPSTLTLLKGAMG